MGRLIAVLWLTALAVPCWGRVLVVIPKTALENADDITPANYNLLAQREQIRGVLDAFGVDYDVVPPNIARTEFCRIGTMTYNFGTSSAFTRSYDAVIHVVGTALSTAGAFPGYRADSLFSSTKVPTVPQLFYTWSYNWSTTSASCAACSLGIQRSSGGYNGNTNWQGTTVYDGTGTLRMRANHLDGYMLTYLYPGVVRGLLFQKVNSSSAQEVLPTDGAPCMDCDSLAAGGAVGDTVSMYLIKNTNAAQAKAIVVCDFGHNHFDQSSPQVAMMGLAALDSLTGGLVIKKHLSLGLYMTGGFRRSGRTTWGGIAPHDSANFKASLDSLASIGARVTVGVNLAADSLVNYASDFAWYRRLSNPHFAPENWQSVNGSDSTRGGGNASLVAPVDPLGLYRKRAQYGDSASRAVMGSDSSTYTLLKASFKILSDNGLRADLALVPPLFDNFPITSSGASDSSQYGAYKAGVRAIVFDVNAAGSYGAKANPRTRYTVSGRYGVGSLLGSTINYLGACTMPQDSSAGRWANGQGSDSYTSIPSWGASVEDFWDSVFGSRTTAAARLGGIAAGRANADPFVQGKARVFVFAASDLGSGIRSDYATRPTRPGWWAVKSIVNAARITNALAGRNVVSFEKLGDIEP